MELTSFQPAFSTEDGRASASPPPWKYIQIRVCCCHARGGRGLSIHIQPGPLDEPVSLEVYFPSVADVGDFDRSWRRAHHCSCKCEAKGGGTRGSDSPGDAQKKGLLRSVVDHLRNKVGHLPTEILWDFPRKHHEDPPPQYVTKLFVLDFNCQPLGRVPIFFMSVSTGIVALDNSREV